MELHKTELNPAKTNVPETDASQADRSETDKSPSNAAETNAAGTRLSARGKAARQAEAIQGQPDEAAAPAGQPEAHRQLERQLAQKLEQLRLREEALAQKERRLVARKRLQHDGLPESLLAHLDYHSDEALLSGLELASLAAKVGLVAHVPKGGQDRQPLPDTYRGRAELYLCDRGQYESLMGGKNHV